MFKDELIEGVVVKGLSAFSDSRGWLMEIFRDDEIDGEIRPAMSYISTTRAGIGRGPHAHKEQTDYFVFIGPSVFKVFLWDVRESSGTYMNRMIITAGEGSPKTIIVPPGVVHAYKNIGETDGVVINLPNRLYRGKGKKQSVDEIRHEDDPLSIFRVD